MAGKQKPTVTMRVRLGDTEMEVTGPSDFVQEKIDAFLKQQPASQAAAGSRGTAPAAQPDVAGARKKLSLAQFFRKLALRSDVDRALAAGYYLESSEEKETFTAAEVRDAIRAAKIVPPRNPSDSIAQNIRKGLMMSAGDKEGKMAFVLTTDGEEVIDALLNK